MSLLAGAPVHAYCRTSTTSTATNDGHVCMPPRPDDSGDPIYWATPHITYSIQEDTTAGISLEEMRTATRAAFDAWMSADCGGEPPRIEVTEADTAECALHEYNKELANANILFFVDQGWDSDAARLALTTVTFHATTGEIYDADMALNTDDWTFTTDGTGGLETVDLQSVLTHEAGHFLGLAHSTVPGATMMPTYSSPSQADLRTLSADDCAGICAIYPPAPIADDCDATPRHGFSPLCAADQSGPVPDAPSSEDRCCCTEGGECVDGMCTSGCACSTLPSSSPPWPWALSLTAALSTLLARRRRRRAPRPPAR